MKVFFLTRSLEWGGAEKQLAALAVHLSSRGHEVVVAAFYTKRNLDEGFDGSGVKVVSLDKKGRWDVIGFVFRLTKLIRTEMPDVLHGYLGGPNVLLALLRPLFHGRIVWGIRSSFMDLARYDWLARLMSRLESWLSPVAELIICNSYAGEQICLQRGFPAERLEVIPNGIDTEALQFDPVKRAVLRGRWNIADDATLVGLVGRLDPMKDIDTFLAAASRVRLQSDAMRFVLIGRGFEGLAGLEDNVSCVGEQKDMQGVYSALDILCSSSTGEGFSNVIVEAMACSRPCVVTDVGDSALIVDGTGLVVPSRDVDALSHALMQMATSDRSALGRAARKRVIEHFSMTRLVEDTESKLLRLMDAVAD